MESCLRAFKQGLMAAILCGDAYQPRVGRSHSTQTKTMSYGSKTIFGIKGKTQVVHHSPCSQTSGHGIKWYNLRDGGEHAYRMGGQPLQDVRVIKDLDVMADRHLKWDIHLEDIIQKMLAIDKESQLQSTTKGKKIIYTSTVHSKLEYGSLLADSICVV